MSVQLKDAEIKVKLDLSDASKGGGTLEEKTKIGREERAKEREKERERDRRYRQGKYGRDDSGGRGGKGGRFGRNVLSSGFRGLVTAAGAVRLAPIVGHAVKAAVAATLASMAIGEMDEAFGPYVRGIVNEALPPELKPALKVIDVVGGSGQWWIDLKRTMQALSMAVGQTKLQVGALGVGGEKITPELVADIYSEEATLARHSIQLEKQKLRFRKWFMGSGIGKAIKDDNDREMQKRMEEGMGR